MKKVSRVFGVIGFVIALTWGIALAISPTFDTTVNDDMELRLYDAEIDADYDWFYANDNIFKVKPDASTDVLAMALRGQIVADDTDAVNGPTGHYIGTFGGCEMDVTSSTVNFPLCIGVEGWTKNNSGNNIDNMVGLLSHVAGNHPDSTTTTAAALNLMINGNSGTITNAYGSIFSMAGDAYTGQTNAGSVSNIYGHFISDINAPAGTGGSYTNLTGYYFANQSASYSGNKYAFHNADVSAKIYTEATTQSTSKNTGSIVTEGGIGAEKDIYSGGGIHAPAGLTYSLGANLTNHTTNPGVWASTIIMAKGKPAYYDSTDSRWEYIADDTAVSW